MSENADKPVHIISDSPVKDSTLFGFDGYAKTIAELIANKENKTPLVIGVYGPWGSGKTTLMETVKSRLVKLNNKDLYRTVKTVWFQPWKHKEEDEILAVLIEEIFKTMKRDGFFEGCKAHLETLVKSMNPLNAMGKFVELFSGVDVGEFFSKLEYRERLGFFDTFQDYFDRLIWDYLNWRPKITAREEANDKTGALVIFIDDLDRCPKERIPKVLETIKLFMDKEGCVFVIGAAIEVIEDALHATYGKDSSKFMDKIVQVTFNLPQATEPDFQTYLKEILPHVHEDIRPHLHLIIPAVQNNPRSMKRFLNNLSLQEGLSKNKGNVSFIHLVYWNIIDYVYPALRNDIKANHQTFFTLQENMNKIERSLENKDVWEIPEDKLKTVPESLQKYVKDKGLADIIKVFDIKPDALRQLVTLSGIVESVEEVKEKEGRAGQIDFDKMVEVPTGEFLYGDDKQTKNTERPFMIDVYPVTNSQYKRFVEAGGYTNQEYWSVEGWTWREGGKITKPKYWNEEKWNQPDHPVVGVSYYEAEAYTKWAGKRLPTEEEWEKATRGMDGRKYPWGDEFDAEKCNSRKSGINGTTPVTQYPNGISPYGCYDMAGNVWEWTYSLYSEEQVDRVVRGGSWLNVGGNCRCADRRGCDPVERNYYLGFRCARTL